MNRRIKKKKEKQKRLLEQALNEMLEDVSYVYFKNGSEGIVVKLKDENKRSK